MSLSDPGAKMSKSDKDPNGSIYLMEKPEDILRKFKRAVTDSDTENCVRYDPTNKPGVANLMTIYSAVTGKSFDGIEQEFAGKGYGAFKPAVGEAVVETLRPIREEATRILGDKAYLESVYRAGAQKASYVAEKTLRKVYKKVGFVARRLKGREHERNSERVIAERRRRAAVRVCRQLSDVPARQVVCL